MPTEDALAEMSHSELNHNRQVAYCQWQEKRGSGEDATESEEIFHTFDREMSKRLKRFKEYLAGGTGL